MAASRQPTAMRSLKYKKNETQKNVNFRGNYFYLFILYVPRQFEI